MKKTYIAPSIDALNMYSVMQPLALSKITIHNNDDSQVIEDEAQVYSKKWGTKLWEDM